MSAIIENAKRETKHRAVNIVLFIYVTVLGKSLPIALSRCTSSCFPRRLVLRLSLLVGATVQQGEP
jgi:hypothetical protein